MGQIISTIWRWLGLGGEKKGKEDCRDHETQIPHPPTPPLRKGPRPHPQPQQRQRQSEGPETGHCINIDNSITNQYHPQIKETNWGGISNSVGDIEIQIRMIGPYTSSQSILLVGEGDFSFSASLALAFGSALNMISTSRDSFEFLKKNYRRSINNLDELKARGCVVLHGIDATEMANHPLLTTFKYDRIIYNFPLARFFGRDVPRQTQIGENQMLVGLFMANARVMIEEDGEIHITHKAYGFFREWNLKGVGLSQGLWLMEEVNFERSNYPGYHTKYGFGGDKDFDCSNSKTYKFRLMPT